ADARPAAAAGGGAKGPPPGPGQGPRRPLRQLPRVHAGPGADRAAVTGRARFPNRAAIRANGVVSGDPARRMSWVPCPVLRAGAHPPRGNRSPITDRPFDPSPTWVTEWSLTATGDSTFLLGRDHKPAPEGPGLRRPSSSPTHRPGAPRGSPATSRGPPS